MSGIRQDDFRSNDGMRSGCGQEDSRWDGCRQDVVANVALGKITKEAMAVDEMPVEKRLHIYQKQYLEIALHSKHFSNALI
jgi:hypothetical protein